MTLIVTVPTERVKMKWQDMISTLEAYKGIVSTGMAYVLFDSFPSEEEFKEYLLNKEKEVV
jgi:hypothetical protein